MIDCLCPVTWGQVGEHQGWSGGRGKGGEMEVRASMWFLCEETGKVRSAGLRLAGLNHVRRLWGVGLSLAVWCLALGNENRWVVACSVSA